MEKYLIVIEKAERNYSAFSPDVIGCVATGATVEETAENMKEALQFHFEDNNELPSAKGISEHIANGVFDKKNIADEYFITEIQMRTPQHA
ncbi:MAG: type II toxin-antitoxin system HicB family antitoxin [Ginsengibacter sp.]